MLRFKKTVIWLSSVYGLFVVFLRFINYYIYIFFLFVSYDDFFRERNNSLMLYCLLVMLNGYNDL